MCNVKNVKANAIDGDIKSSLIPIMSINLRGF